jgi:DNA-directed RNA polymerase subunit F
MKTDTRNKTGNGNTATAALARINNQIAELQQQRVALAEPLKTRYAEMRGELSALETEIRSLDAAWKPAPLKPRADDKIREIITEHGKPMTTDEIVKAVGSVFTPWKVRNTLKKKSTGAKAIFALVDGKYSLKAA